MKMFPLTQCDGYKLGHYKMYQNGSELIYSNFTPRSDRLFKGSSLCDNKMVVFGIQGFIKEFLIEQFNEGFFKQSKEKAVNKYKRRVDAYLGKGAIDVGHIAALHDLGYLPLEIRAIQEGSRVPMKIPVMTVQNTLPEFYWLTNYLETVWSNSVWKSMTNATIAFEYKRVFDKYADLTGVPKEATVWQGHDFSLRGMSGPEDGARSGAAHLTSFCGTDTVSAIDYLEDYYNADVDKELVAMSVPATEHSVATSNILFFERDGMSKEEAEEQFIIKYITEIAPTGIASYVADSFDYWKVISEILPNIKDVIMHREGKLVVRPDSGDPVKVICGDKEADEGSPEHKGSVQVLWETFGGTITDKGYKLLDEHIGLIYGDSITLERQEAILSGLMGEGFASGNVVLGVGSYTYNYSTRDTFGSAVKATMSKVDGEYLEIYKDPATAQGKKSAKGWLKVELVDGEYILKDCVSEEESKTGELQLVFKDGGLFNETSLLEIRERLN
jgi:nicotinamide phosphoribosyltransferase